jgi:hypothetical protein
VNAFKRWRLAFLVYRKTCPSSVTRIHLFGTVNSITRTSDIFLSFFVKTTFSGFSFSLFFVYLLFLALEELVRLGGSHVARKITQQQNF